MAKPLRDLRRLLVARLSLSDVRTICFDMGIDSEQLPGDTLGDKLRELISACDRSQRISELLSTVADVRSDLELYLSLNDQAAAPIPLSTDLSGELPLPNMDSDTSLSSKQPSSTRVIRTTLMQHFTEDEIRIFCYDNYRGVYNQLSKSTTKDALIQSLIEHCDRTNKLNELYELILNDVLWSNHNIYTSKPDIDQVWQEMLIGATKSINIFAGDVSWIDRDKELITQIIKDRVNISVLCRPPHNEKTQQNVADLLGTRANVRYYDIEYAPPIRGLLIDSEEPRESTALTVDKSARQIIAVSNQASIPSVTRGSGVSGSNKIYNHKAIRHLPEDDSKYVAVLNRLFSFYWQTSLDSLILYPIKLNTHNIAQCLSIVPHYKEINENDIQIEILDTNELWAACTYVKQEKLRSIKAILKAYEYSSLQPFSACVCISNRGKSLLLPPIIERHDGKYIIIDGMHRIFHTHVFDEKQEILCLIISTKTPPPSSPVPLGKVQMWPRKLPKNQVFLDYKPELLRKIKLLDQALKDDFYELVESGL